MQNLNATAERVNAPAQRVRGAGPGDPAAGDAHGESRRGARHPHLWPDRSGRPRTHAAGRHAQLTGADVTTEGPRELRRGDQRPRPPACPARADGRVGQRPVRIAPSRDVAFGPGPGAHAGQRAWRSASADDGGDGAPRRRRKRKAAAKRKTAAKRKAASEDARPGEAQGAGEESGQATANPLIATPELSRLWRSGRPPRSRRRRGGRRPSRNPTGHLGRPGSRPVRLPRSVRSSIPASTSAAAVTSARAWLRARFSASVPRWSVCPSTVTRLMSLVSATMRSSSSIAAAVSAASPGSNRASAANEQRIVVGAGMVVVVVVVDVVVVAWCRGRGGRGRGGRWQRRRGCRRGRRDELDAVVVARGAER